MKQKTKFKNYRRVLFLPLLYAFASGLSGCEKDYNYIAPIPTDTVYYKAEIQPIWDAECTGCHDGSLSPDLTPPNSWASLISGGLVNVGDPASSTLYVRMNSSTNPMPPGGKLSADKIQLVLTWIQQGANNN